MALRSGANFLNESRWPQWRCAKHFAVHAEAPREPAGGSSDRFRATAAWSAWIGDRCRQDQLLVKRLTSHPFSRKSTASQSRSSGWRGRPPITPNLPSFRPPRSKKFSPHAIDGHSRSQGLDSLTVHSAIRGGPVAHREQGRQKWGTPGRTRSIREPMHRGENIA